MSPCVTKKTNLVSRQVGEGLMRPTAHCGSPGSRRTSWRKWNLANLCKYDHCEQLSTQHSPCIWHWGGVSELREKTGVKTVTGLMGGKGMLIPVLHSCQFPQSHALKALGLSWTPWKGHFPKRDRNVPGKHGLPSLNQDTVSVSETQEKMEGIQQEVK